MPACDADDPFDDTPGKVARFSLHAGVAAKARERKKLERLCRYIARPAVSEQRLSLTSKGNVRDQLKTPYRDGTTHVIFERLDFIARLAALVPKPRVNLTRFHGVFAPNSKHRAMLTPAKRGKGNQVGTRSEATDRAPAERRAGMTPDQVRGRLWAQRLKRVFNIDIETCRECGGAVRVAAPARPCARGISASMHVIACIENPVLIKKILTHLKEKAASTEPIQLPKSRAPPQAGLGG